MKRKAVSYIRYSSDNQTENSVETQREQISEFSRRFDYDLVNEYVDRAQSGTNSNRASFQSMMEDATSPERTWDTVLVRDYSRFSRKESDAFYYVDQLESLGIQLISVTQNFGDGVESEMIRGFTHVMDAHYSRKLSETTRAGMLTKAKEACLLGGKPPLGYRKASNGRMELDPEGARTVKKVFELYTLNYSSQEIVNILNTEGHRTANGNLFKVSSLPSILKQEKYTGVYIWNRAESKNPITGRRNNSASKPQVNQVRIPKGCPQIITPEQFQKVQQMMKERKKNGSMLSNRHHYMLSGLDVLYCKSCGARMSGNPKTTHGRSYFTYACPNHRKHSCDVKDIKAEDLDRFVGEHLADDLLNRSDWAEIELNMQNDTRVSELKARKQGIEKAISNLVLAIQNVCSDELLEKLKIKQDEKNAVEQQLKELESSGFKLTEENKTEFRRRVIDYWIHSHDPEARMYLKTVIQKIEVDNEQVEVTLNIN